ncbi:hypothetical protein MTO96_052115, partial [Rhipicephalus appendiculatus]
MAREIYSWPIRQYNVLFYIKKNADLREIRENFREAAAPFKHQVLFVSVDVEENSEHVVMKLFDTNYKVPTQRFVDFENIEELEYYQFKPETNSLKAEDIKTFVQGVLDGRIKPDLLSQDLPDDWDKNPVKVVVGKNFAEVVLDKTKDVLVMFYVPDWPSFQHVAPMYEELAKKYKDRKDVLIVKVDVSANQIHHNKVLIFPTFRLYKKETNEVVEFEGDRTLKRLSKFIDTNGEYGSTYPGG